MKVASRLEQAHPVDVLIWARIRANKRGSFEAYLQAMAECCQAQGLSTAFVLVEGTQAALLERFHRIGVSVFEMPPEDWMSPAALKRVLAAFQPQIVHFHFYSVVSPLWSVAKRSGARVYLSAHSSLPELSSTKRGGFSEFVRKLRRRYFASKIDRFLPVSEFLAGDLRSASGVSSKRITTIANGVDCGRFAQVDEAQRHALKQRLSLRADVPVISFVGQIELHKGILDFCEAMVSVRKQRDVEVLIAGDGSQLAAMRERFPQYRWLGRFDSVEQILGASDMLVCPSRWQEAFGLVIAEASACGVPVVASDRGGIPEVVSDGETGVLVPAANPAVLCDRIVDLLDDEALRLRMGQAARERALGLFALEKQVELTVQLYRKDLAIGEPDGQGKRLVNA